MCYLSFVGFTPTRRENGDNPWNSPDNNLSIIIRYNMNLVVVSFVYVHNCHNFLGAQLKMKTAQALAAAVLKAVVLQLQLSLPVLLLGYMRTG